MAHRDERLPKTEEARVMSHDPLIPDATEEDQPMFTAQEVLAADAAAKHEEDINRDRPMGRDEDENAENSADADESANVADRGQLEPGGPIEPRNEKDAERSGDKQTKAADVTPKRKSRSKAKES